MLQFVQRRANRVPARLVQIAQFELGRQVRADGKSARRDAFSQVARDLGEMGSVHFL
ncbi:hypothetical protein [Burkholderia contaminans]|uniref:hypothetical protein n=1 Tax=Burkholderia contaminans TaxID=488447 RepID=UPI0021AB4EED|nr:hypothetical protein [Burkholderia contaminans]